MVFLPGEQNKLFYSCLRIGASGLISEDLNLTDEMRASLTRMCFSFSGTDSPVRVGNHRVAVKEGIVESFFNPVSVNELTSLTVSVPS